MTKAALDIGQAFISHKRKTTHNCRCDGDEVRLYGNRIAWRDEAGDVFICCCGRNTQAMRRYINSVLFAVKSDLSLRTVKYALTVFDKGRERAVAIDARAVYRVTTGKLIEVNDKKRAYCAEGEHYPQTMIATVEGCELGVIVCDDDSVTNWADGTAGVPPDIAELARADESPVCAEHPDCEVEWR